MPISLLPHHAKKQSPRLHLATVIGQLSNLNGGVADDSRPGQLRNKLFQSHRERFYEADRVPLRRRLWVKLPQTSALP